MGHGREGTGCFGRGLSEWSPSLKGMFLGRPLGMGKGQKGRVWQGAAGPRGGVGWAGWGVCGAPGGPALAPQKLTDTKEISTNGRSK